MSIAAASAGELIRNHPSGIDPATVLKPRLVIGLVTIAAVLATELGIHFCFNARLAITGL